MKTIFVILLVFWRLLLSSLEFILGDFKGIEKNQEEQPYWYLS